MAGEMSMSSVDFCFLFDCQNGAIGGLIDPCGNPPLFADCGDGTDGDDG
jgi:hypothetical protein